MFNPYMVFRGASLFCLDDVNFCSIRTYIICDVFHHPGIATMKIRTLWIIGGLALAAALAPGQVTLNIGPNLHGGKIGLGLDGITGSPNLLVKYFFTSRLAGEALAGFAVESPGGDTPAGQTKVTGITFRGGLGILYHLLEEQVSPYVGVEILFQSDKPAGFYTQVPDPKNTVMTALVLGGEYFMNERFSFGIKQALGAEFDLARDTPSEPTNKRLATSTLVTGRFYFN
jgi:hypothetical protein